MDEVRLAVADPAALSHDARLDALEAVQRHRSAIDAYEQGLLAAIAGSDERVEQWVREEVSVILRVAPQTTAARLRTAQDLVARLPATVEALAAGRVTLNHARALVDAVEHLDVDATATVEERVLARCRGKSVAEFRAHCRRAALSVDPRRADERHAAAVERREVTFAPECDGMASLTLFAAARDITTIRHRVDAHAATLAGDAAGDSRTADQKRADVLVDLLVGKEPAAASPVPVQATISLASLRGLTDEPGTLDGEPVTAAVLRELVNGPATWWRAALIDDEDGHLIAAGAYQYRPSAALKRLVELRDRTCRFPGCRRRAPRTEIDHIVPFSCGGLTVAENLHLLCKRHHRLKDRPGTGWHVFRRANGTTVWHSPTGRRYEKEPDHYPGASEPVGEPAPDPPPF